MTVTVRLKTVNGATQRWVANTYLLPYTEDTMPAPVEMKSAQGRDTHGRFAEKGTPPMVSVTVTNPVTYLKLWWKKVMGNEGIDIRFRVAPLTALTLGLILAAGSYSLGRFTVPSQIVKYLPQLAVLPTPTPNPWRETAFSGTLRFSEATQKFYLATSSSEAITLEVPIDVNLKSYIGRRIFATGRLNTVTRILIIADAQDLELLPTQVTLIPTVTPPPSSPTPKTTVSPSADTILPATPLPTANP